MTGWSERLVVPWAALRGAGAALPWRPLRPGVDILPIGGPPDGPTVALLRYAPGAAVPRHLHTGAEHVFVLEGEQRDERGTYPAGTMVVNPAGSRHAVASESGCLVLVSWERPVTFEE